MSKKNNYALLFTNDRKISKKSPDYEGKFELNGKTGRAAAWIKIAKNNKKYISISFSETEKNISIHSDTPKTKSEIETKPTSKKPLRSTSVKKNTYVARPSKEIVEKIKMKRSLNLYSNQFSSSSSRKKPIADVDVKVSSAGTKKRTPTYVRYVKETFGTREDHKKDRGRTFSEVKTNRVVDRFKK